MYRVEFIDTLVTKTYALAKNITQIQEKQTDGVHSPCKHEQKPDLCYVAYSI